MSHQYSNHDGSGVRKQSETFITAKPSALVIASNAQAKINAHIDQTFANVEPNLKHAGGKGWEQVFRANSYHVQINEALEVIVRNVKGCIPNHHPFGHVLG
ncbi:hypothetical protein N7453_001250 [Penicillium expansum]|nr:hypothetical protein N7453_001250 [Penicillium expansum]